MKLRRFLAGISVLGLLACAAAAAVLLRPDPAGASITPQEVDLSPLDRIPAAAWDRLAARRIYFAHKSVGDDIVAGIEQIRAARPQISLAVLAADGPGEQPGMTHCQNGTNEDPMSKIAAFSAGLESGPAPDIAILKFCYVDYGALPPAELFAAYKAAIDSLRSRNPGTTFIHVTMPLTHVASGPRARLRALLGRDVTGYSQNRVRNEYNRLLRAEYSGREPVFDLARTESTLPDGRRATFDSDQECMAAGYTSDGGHLSEAGRLAAARDFLLTLAGAAE
ncbi:MAG: SGNH/GDSL hydrolase family protein [Phycisphaerales bacterium]|nr:SGNH/GDSL hydrolase family protein [Phycisphaerales bacterium]